MFDLPVSLTRHFRKPSGKVKYRALLRSPDVHLLAIARQMHPLERAVLSQRLREFRLNWLQHALARSAGIDVDYERRRFLRILAEAEIAVRRSSPGQAHSTANPGNGLRSHEQGSPPDHRVEESA